MVKVGWKRNTRKVCKKRRKFYENRREVAKVGGNNFRETGGK